MHDARSYSTRRAVQARSPLARCSGGLMMAEAAPALAARGLGWQMVRPFFDSGSVETAMKRGEGGTAHGAAILSEVEEEQEFERLVLKMRQALPIKDRVQNRIPFFKVRVQSLIWPCSVVAVEPL